MATPTTTTTTTTTTTSATAFPLSRLAARRRRSDVRQRVTGFVLLVLCCWPAVAQYAGMLVHAASASGSTNSSGNGDALDGVPIMGIDLGTTYSVVALYDSGRVHVLTNDQGNKITPSYVSFHNGERLIGDAAKGIASTEPKNTVFSVKRLIGRYFDTPEVKADAKLVPYKIVDQNNKPYIQVEVSGEEKRYAPEEISAMVLSKMRETAEAFHGKPIRHAVITVPAYFNDAQRQATKDAAVIAGLIPVRIINEPTAAALAYGAENGGTRKGEGEKNVLVFDLGGGTFDVSILTLDDGVYEVLATTGDTHLGGDDFDARVMEHFVKVCANKYGADIRKDDRALAKLRREAERAKRTLSSQHETKVEVESLCGGRDFSETLTRAKFEELNADLFKRVLAPLQSVLKDSKLKKTQIDEVLLVGGSTRIPKVQQILRDFFNGKELNRGVNPDEAVAVGAAVQGSILNGMNRNEMVLIDVASLSIGIETVGGVMTRVVERQTAIPAVKKQVFSTYQDDQTSVMIQVYQGERQFTKDNVLLGKFELNGIRKAPRGVPKIEVTFELSSENILTVSANDADSKVSKSISIDQNKGGLSKADIDRMIHDAELNFEADKAAAAAVEKRNKLDGYAHRLKAQIDESGDEHGALGDKLSADDKQTMRSALDAAIDWLEANPDAPADDVAKQHRELEAVCAPIVKRAYETHGGAPPSDGSGDGDDDDVPNHDEL